ncbi:MAG: tyrosine-type recombinase/integrase [Thermoflavifilum sp.]|nr:tyrosine-type recombinase/integrase [Thermoflavifilum sp.]MCL6514030.1 tyrosine-type recombinase/integrase [Alicyclobacillus sp.]
MARQRGVILPMPTATASQGRHTPTIAECRSRYLDDLIDVGRRSERTAKAYEQEINKFIRFLPKKADTPITDITETTMKQYFTFVNHHKRKWEDHPFNAACAQKTGLSPTTVNNMRRYLNAFFNYLVAEEIIEENPMRRIKKLAEHDDGDTELLTKREILRLMQQPDRRQFHGFRDVTLIQFLIDTAMRLGQCLELQVSDIIVEQRLVRVRPEITKTGKGRYVVITDGTAHMLKTMIRLIRPVTEAGVPWLWVTAQGTRLSASTFAKQLKKYGAMAGIKPEKVHPHALRTFSAVQHRKNGASIDEVQALLDHTDITTTMRYLRRFEHDMRKINELYSPAHELFKKPGRRTGKSIVEPIAEDAELHLSSLIS